MISVRKFLDASICHLPAALQLAILDDSHPMLACWPSPGGEGAFVHVGEVLSLREEFPVDVRRLFALARECGCEYVLFDTGGPEIDWLELYPHWSDEMCTGESEAET